MEIEGSGGTWTPVLSEYCKEMEADSRVKTLFAAPVPTSTLFERVFNIGDTKAGNKQ